MNEGTNTKKSADEWENEQEPTICMHVRMNLYCVWYVCDLTRE